MNNVVLITENKYDLHQKLKELNAKYEIVGLATNMDKLKRYSLQENAYESHTEK